MPIFKYICKQCNHPFEMLIRGSDRPECPSCQRNELEKQLSVFATSSGESRSANDFSAGACGSCGDPRGPGACSVN